MAASAGTTLRAAPDPQHVPVRVAEVPGSDRQGPTAGLHGPSEQAAADRFAEFTETWGGRYPAITRLWTNAWSEFVPFLDHDIEIRRVICSTNAIESLNTRYRRAVKAHGHSPTEQATLKRSYLVTRSLDPTGRSRASRTTRWKPALNALATTFPRHIVPSTAN